MSPRILLICCAAALALTLAATGDEPALSPQAIIAEAQKLNATDTEAAAKLLRDAVQRLQAQTKADGKNADAWYNLACVAFELGSDDQAALAAINNAIRLAPQMPRYYQQRGLMQLQLGDRQAAETDYAKGVQLAPKDPQSHLALATYYHTVGRAKAELAAIQSAIKADPAYAEASLRLAIFRIDAGEQAEALKILRRVQQASPKAAETRDGLGQLLQELGEREAAIAIYQELVREDPNNISYLGRLIQLCSALGRNAERDKLLEQAYESHRSGKATQPMVFREKFTVNDIQVSAAEFFELHGKFKTKLQFDATTQGKKPRSISYRLETPDFTTDAARELGTIKADERMYALDLYGESGRIGLIFMFARKQPDYDKVREKVVEHLKRQKVGEEEKK